MRIFISKIHRFLHQSNWPIDKTANKKPENWKGWPGGKKFALLISHDVEDIKGYERVLKLYDIDKKFNFVSSFNFVPKRYNADEKIRNILIKNGFEVAVHGLYHDGKLFLSRNIFNERSVIINSILKDWRCRGFYAPSTIKNFDWLHELNIEYDSSTFDTDPFEPQPDGIKTIFPIIIYNKDKSKYYVEIPYTLPQDNTLFNILQEKNINIWKKKIDWIVENNGLVHIRTHPDYMNFDNEKKIDEYPVKYYIELLEYISTKYKNLYWHVLPGELSGFWKENFLI